MRYDFHSIELPEMEYSISIAGNGWNRLNMMRIVDPPIVCRWYPEKYKMDFPNRLPDYFNYQLEKIDISSNSLEIDVLTSMYDNRCISQSER